MNGKLSKWRLAAELFAAFLKMSPITFGGGYAMIPAIEEELVQKRHWMHSYEVTELLTITGTAPGAIAVNIAVCIGFRMCGILGAIAAMIGLLIPTFLIVVLLTVFYLQFRNVPKIAAAFEGIRPAIVALILVAAVRVGRMSLFDKTTIGIAAATVILLFATPLHPAFVIPLGMITGIAAVRIKKAIGQPVLFYKENEPSSQDSDQAEQEYKYPDYFIGDGI